MINAIPSVYIHCDSLFMIAVLYSKVSTRIKICVKCLIFYYSPPTKSPKFLNHDDMTSIANVQNVGSSNFNNMTSCPRGSEIVCVVVCGKWC